MNRKPPHLAVLIDGDFVDPKQLGRVMAEADKHGTVVVRRIYGSHTKLSSWAECIRLYGFEPVPDYSGAKNASDIDLIVGAMDVLRSKVADGFCIVANDNHFAGLVSRLRREGAFVAGIGSPDKEKKSPLRDECNIFTHVDDLPPLSDPDPAIRKITSGWKKVVREAVGMCAQEDSWALMSDVGNRILEIRPSFEYRAYCQESLLPLVESCPEFETRDGWWVRMKTKD